MMLRGGFDAVTSTGIFIPKSRKLTPLLLARCALMQTLIADATRHGKARVRGGRRTDRCRLRHFHCSRQTEVRTRWCTVSRYWGTTDSCRRRFCFKQSNGGQVSSIRGAGTRVAVIGQRMVLPEYRAAAVAGDRVIEFLSSAGCDTFSWKINGTSKRGLKAGIYQVSVLFLSANRVQKNTNSIRAT
jgi:hypothetical protein